MPVYEGKILQKIARNDWIRENASRRAFDGIYMLLAPEITRGIKVILKYNLPTPLYEVL